jgi:Zn-dependent protease with chaperone function
MRLRTLLLLLTCLAPLAAPAAYAAPTPTEAAAIAAAEQNHTAYALPPDELAKAQHLHTIGVLTHFSGALWGILSIFLILQLGIAARIRNIAVNLTKNRWGQGYIFLFLFLILNALLSLPLDLYSQHISRVYGLSVQSWGSWFLDQGKGFGLAYPFGGLFFMLLFWLIRKYPRTWWLPLWAAASAVAIFAFYLSPIMLDPLFNKFEPLSKTNPELVQKLEQVVARGDGIQIPPERMFLMKASDKVTTLNAYVTGFGASKRVVVWDTSIAKCTPDEILFIFGHEMGHYVLGHIVSGMALTVVLLFVAFALGFYGFQFLLARFGPRWRITSPDNWAAFYIFVLVLTVLSFFAEPIANTISRAQEHAADVYGEEVVHTVVADPQSAGRSAFQIVGENSFSDPAPHPLVSFWTGNHPPIWFRAAFAQAYNPWAPGNAPKYLKK